jgi:hypothetical protein
MFNVNVLKDVAHSRLPEYISVIGKKANNTSLKYEIHKGKFN